MVTIQSATLDSNRHVIVTEVIDAIMDAWKPIGEITILSGSVMITFINARTNTEDAWNLMSECAESETFT